jgi:DNA-binding XRE family transcriptional regulator/molybdate-binding protein
MTFGHYLAELRQARGLSQRQLAEALQVSRQTIIALEHNHHAPSFDLAVRIARLFDISLDGMAHALAAGGSSNPQPFPGSPDVAGFLPVVWSRVGSRLVVVPLDLLASQTDADALWDPGTGQLQPLPGARAPDQVILAGGCDPFHHWLATSFHQLSPTLFLETVHLSSLRALEAFNQGWLHVAGTHLYDDALGSYNPDHLVRQPHIRIPYLRWEEGLICQPHATRITHVAIREPGSEAHALYQRCRSHVPHAVDVFSSHGSILEAVSRRSEWAGISLGPLAALKGLTFEPWAEESYDLWIHRDAVPQRWVEVLLAATQSDWLASRFRALKHLRLASAR